MNSLLGTLAPGITAKLNLVADLCWLLASVVLATLWSSRQLGGPELAWFAVAATAVWLITSTALRHYDPAANREVMDDVALVSILVLAVTTALALVSLVGPDTAVSLPRVPQFLVTLWPISLLLRLVIFRQLSEREGPLDEVLILGTGPMGRITAEDLTKRGRRKVVGFLRFDDEPRPDNLRASFLGTASELDNILRTVPVSEVYVAGSNLRYGDAMQAAIKTCEKFGIPFALPAYSFRLDRARPVASKAIVDGYLHYVSVDVKPSQMALKRLFDIVASAIACCIASA